MGSRGVDVVAPPSGGFADDGFVEFTDDLHNGVTTSASATKELLAYLRSVAYTAIDPSTSAPVKCSGLALQSVPISSLYFNARQMPDGIGLSDPVAADVHTAYIKARSCTAVTAYPLLVSLGIRTVAQLRRISATDVDVLRHAMCRDSAGAGLLGALLARVHADAVDPSLDGLAVARASAAGSGCYVRCDAHRGMAVAVDRRPAEHGLRWHRERPRLTVVCRQCAPATFAADVAPRLAARAVVCPRPPTTGSPTRRAAAVIAATSPPQTAASLPSSPAFAMPARLFEPQENATTGRVFEPRLTTLHQNLLPTNSLPEDCDATRARQHRQLQALATSVGEITADDVYDPFRCHAAMTFTLDEITVITTLMRAVSGVLTIQRERAEGAAADASAKDVAVDTTSRVTAHVLAAALHSLGVAQEAAASIASSCARGRHGSIADFGSSLPASARGSAAMLRRSGGAARSSASLRRAGSSAGSGRGLSSADRRGSQTTSSNSNAAIPRGRSVFTRGRASAAEAAAAQQLVESRRGTVSISDVASWIEQRLDAPKFLRKLFCRFSRSTPWIIFRHELDEMIRGRVTGIDLILRMMDDASADILPFARFCGEASHGRLAIVFAEVFLASAVTFIFETTRAVNKPNIRSAGSGVSSLLRRGMSIST